MLLCFSEDCELGAVVVGVFFCLYCMFAHWVVWGGEVANFVTFVFVLCLFGGDDVVV